MTLYLAKETAQTLMEGDFERIHGVYSTPELALEGLRVQFYFKNAIQTDEYRWTYHYDGTVSYYYEVIETKLDQIIE